jgi:hypothetical protein
MKLVTALTAIALCGSLGSCMTAKSTQQQVAEDVEWCKTQQPRVPIDACLSALAQERTSRLQAAAAIAASPSFCTANTFGHVTQMNCY